MMYILAYGVHISVMYVTPHCKYWFVHVCWCSFESKISKCLSNNLKRKLYV